METLTTKQFESIYHEFHGKIFAHINVRIKSRELVEELTNDTFVKVFKYYSMYDKSLGQFNTWLYTIANNCMKDYWRKKQLETTDLSLYGDKDDAREVMYSITDETPYTVIVRKEITDNVQSHLNTLPETLRDVARLFFNEQLSYEEIRTCLDMPLGTVKGYIFRARKILKEQLEPMYS